MMIFNTLDTDAAAIDKQPESLQVGMDRIDRLIQRQVARWEAAGQDPNDRFRGLFVTGEEVQGLMSRPLASNWGAVSVSANLEEPCSTDLPQPVHPDADAMAQMPKQAARLSQLQAEFCLSRLELDTLLISLASSIDLRYERVFGFLQDDVTRKRPTVNLVLDLLAPPGLARAQLLSLFDAESPLIKFRLLRLEWESASRPPLLGQYLVPDETVVHWLLTGGYQPAREVATGCCLQRPEETAADGKKAGEIWQRVAPMLEHQPLLGFHGADRTAQDAAARLCAVRMSLPLLRVDLDWVRQSGFSPFLAINLALRDGRLLGALPYLTGWDACLDGDTNIVGLFELIDAYPGSVILAGRRLWQVEGVNRRHPLFWLEFPIPGYQQRLSLWQHFLGETRLADDEVVKSLAGQFTLTTGQIEDAVISAGDAARQVQRAVSAEDVLAAARRHSNPRLAKLARQIVPRYTWDDIILPEDQKTQLWELVDSVRCRPMVLEEWGVGQKLASSAGLTVLFAGPPGTGKTMAAEIIAAELGLDLYKIDLSTVVSKYIGETEKNLERIFNEAQSSNSILFFDEADAIFGKRSEVKDAHDRYANIEVSYLLQRMEAYDGVTILATNLRANLDDAFTRRLQFAVDFPFPEVPDRLRIWETLFPPLVPRQEDLDFELLARRFKLAGGNIRNIIMSAAYLAAADGKIVAMEHLMHATRRELQKLGRLVDETRLTTENI